MKTAPLPVVVHYCATFLKPEMLHLYRQITGLTRFRSRVITQKRENAGAFPFDEVTVIPKPATHQLRRLWQKSIRDRPIRIYESEARKLAAELQRTGAALLHIYFGHIGVMLLPLIERAPCPVVVSFHGADGMVDMHKPVHREATERMLREVRLVLARSESLAARLDGLGCPREKLRIHRTGIPLTELAFMQRASAPNDSWRFVQACRLIEKKGLRTSLRAFAGFARDFPNATLTIAGEGPMEAELKVLASELALGGRVVFTGFLSQVALRDLYGRSHVFVHPSELGADGNQEGVPNSMLEAMATGLPVIATNHGGIPEAVESGLSGLLVEEGDCHRMERAMRELAADPALYANLSRGAGRAVAEKFEQSAQIRVLEGYYDEVLSG